MLDKELLKTTAAAVGIEVDAVLAERLDIYARLLVEWNEKMNLTAIIHPTDIAIKHFADSLSAAPLLPKGAFSLIDVGTGAGFPGMPLAMFRSDCQLTLLDSLNKRLVFLQEVCKAVGVDATFLHLRAEDGGKKAELREQFDVATARAVGALPLLCEYCLPYVKVGGRFLALKGPTGEEESEKSRRAMVQLGGKVKEVKKLYLPADSKGETGERQIFFIDKCAQTPSKFPRPAAKIAKNPL